MPMQYGPIARMEVCNLARYQELEDFTVARGISWEQAIERLVDHALSDYTREADRGWGVEWRRADA